ncbi:hypothetical protein ABZ801_15160 [Actinomadura sp. NPDC047616]|uniref:hypothetical protein n=1 Tax=Actinomadura sp. NPDC047616 TaxID=3155914 RepID=UPI0033F61933
MTTHTRAGRRGCVSSVRAPGTAACGTSRRARARSALAGHPGAALLLDGVIDSWLEPLVGLEDVPGLTAAGRRTRARLVLAFTRGALLDLLATGDREEVDRMVDDFIALTLPA